MINDIISSLILFNYNRLLFGLECLDLDLFLYAYMFLDLHVGNGAQFVYLLCTLCSISNKLSLLKELVIRVASHGYLRLDRIHHYLAWS